MQLVETGEAKAQLSGWLVGIAFPGKVERPVDAPEVVLLTSQTRRSGFVENFLGIGDPVIVREADLVRTAQGS